jgi:hypothetical protein
LARESALSAALRNALRAVVPSFNEATPALVTAENLGPPSERLAARERLVEACTAATSPNLYRVTELVPGISTRDDAIAKLGPPISTSNIGNSTILQ